MGILGSTCCAPTPNKYSSDEQNDNDAKKGLLSSGKTDNVSKEIIELHEFFVNWFSGSVPIQDKTKAFKQFESRFHTDFSMHTCSDSILDRSTVMNWIDGAYESEKETNFKIEIKNIRILKTMESVIEKLNWVQLNLSDDNIDINDDNIVVVSYEEWQKNDTKTKHSSRQSYVVFVKENNDTKASPNGVLWRKLKEEWINEHIE
eukprot:409493_1